MSCEFCKKADFGNYSAKVDKYSASIYLAGGSSRFPKDEQFKYCPLCGEPLAEPVPLTLEQLREMDRRPVWVKWQGDYAQMRVNGWDIVGKTVPHPRENFDCGYSESWLAYSHKPKEV